MEVSNENVDEIKRKIEKQRRIIVILAGLVLTIGFIVLFK